MNESTETTTEVTTETPQAVETPQSTEQITENDVQGATGEAQAAVEQDVQAAFTPNYKFKVKDKELEFDNIYKPLIKDAEFEKKVRELHEKAYGLDEVKSSRDSFKKQFDDVSQKYSEIENSLKVVGEFVKKGDFRSFFETLGIPKDKIISYAIDELKFAELPKEQREAVEQQRAMMLDYDKQMNVNQQMQQQIAKMVQQQAEFSLNQELSKPEVAQIAQSFDSRLGKPGAFMSEVIRRGQYYEAVHKQSPTASQLVEEVIGLIGSANLGAQPQGINTQVTQGQHNSASQTHKEKPVIAVPSGNMGKSPTKKVYTSIDDLRKARQQMNQV